MVGQGGKAEFLEPLAGTYQGFFETKQALFLETRLAGCFVSLGRWERKAGRRAGSEGTMSDFILRSSLETCSCKVSKWFSCDAARKECKSSS